MINTMNLDVVTQMIVYHCIIYFPNSHEARTKPHNTPQRYFLKLEARTKPHNTPRRYFFRERGGTACFSKN